MKTIQKSLLLMSAVAGLVFGQASPPKTETGKIGGKTITIKYAAPSVRGRKIFGEGGRVMQDSQAPIWRAGANAATILETQGDLDIAGLKVPAGKYSLFVNVKDEKAWELIINKQTGQWGLRYDARQDLGKVKMTMSKPPVLVEMLRYVVEDSGNGKGSLSLSWENHIATVAVSAR